MNISDIQLLFRLCNVFVFGDLNAHNKGWITYSSGTGKSFEPCSNFSISNDLTEMAIFPTLICVFESHSLASGFVNFY